MVGRGLRRGSGVLVLVAGLGASADAQAGLLDLWEYDSYESGSSMVGVDGWTGGFSVETWLGYAADGSGTTYLLSSTDVNDSDYPGAYGEGGALDNWLVNEGVSVVEGELRVEAYTKDDDTLGILFRFQDAQNFYGLLLCGPEGSSPISDLSGPYAALVRVSGGTLIVLDHSTDTYSTGRFMGLALSDNDGLITGSYWEKATSSWGDPDLVLSATDTELSGSGAVGVYAYDAGGTGSGETLTLFGTVALLQQDDDDDDVADDVDNCESVANGDQADRDGDGFGDLCDEESPDTGSPDGGDTGATDSGDTEDTGETAETGRDSADTETGRDTGSTEETATEDTEGVETDSAASDSDAEDSGSPVVDVGPSADLDDVSLAGACAAAPRSGGGAALLALVLALARRRERR